MIYVFCEDRKFFLKKTLEIGSELLFICRKKHVGMDEAKDFRPALDIAGTVCEFIAGGRPSVFRRITGVNFGVSASVVTVRLFGKSPDLEDLEERTIALYGALVKLGAKKLTVEAFSEGVKYVHYYEEEKFRHSQNEDHIPDGMYFRVDSEGGDPILRDNALLLGSVWHIISPLIDYTSETEFFLNGERFFPPQ